MASLQSMLDAPPAKADPKDFSIILGGPLYQLLRRAHIRGDALELLRRRVITISMFTCLPLLLLCAIAGTAFGDAVAIPFIEDVQVHARFLLAMPLLILAELVVHLRLRPVAAEFVTRGLVADSLQARFNECLRSAMRLRNSVIAELLILVVIYGIGVTVVWREAAVLDVSTWYATASNGESRLTLAGIWYVYVSVPVFQFLLLRWYYRVFIWMRFLWQVSRIPLAISAMHGDRMAGLGFLAGTVFAFVPLAMAHGALLAGTIANQILYAGAKLVDSKFEIASVVALLLLLVLGPLVVFAPQVAAAKRHALRIYGRLSQRYVREFEATWLPGGLPSDAPLLGAADIQSLADLSNSIETLRSTKTVPITRDAVLGLAIATLVPLAPLLLTVFPAEEIATRLLKLLL
jgi:hypothetical protein